MFCVFPTELFGRTHWSFRIKLKNIAIIFVKIIDI